LDPCRWGIAAQDTWWGIRRDPWYLESHINIIYYFSEMNRNSVQDEIYSTHKNRGMDSNLVINIVE
jgi:hypothetical protein